MLSLNNIGVRDTNCAVKNPLVIYNQVSVFVEKAMAPPLQYSCLENPMDGGAW